MVFNGWYTDSVEVYRVSDVVSGHIHKQERIKQGEYPCRIYKSVKGAPTMTDRESKLISNDKMAVAIGTDIKPGDELLIIRGASMGMTESQRYFAGDVMPYYEPVGNAFNGLSHVEVGLLQEEVIS